MVRYEDKEICVLINSLNIGGAEKVALKLAEFLNIKKFFLLEKNMAYSVKEKDILFLSSHTNSTPGWWKTFYIPFYAQNLNKLIIRNSTVISFLERANFVNIIASKKSGFKSIASVRMSLVHGRKRFHPYNFLAKILYSKADKVVAVSNGIKEELINVYNVPQEKIRIIYNPVWANEIEKQANEDIEQAVFLCKTPFLITVGRLTYPKGQWFLLRVFRQVKKRNKDLKLMIIGGGDLENYLVKLAEELGFKVYSSFIGDKLHENYDVYFMGFQKNPFKFVSKALLFVFPSLWEGFPNALLEAMACGVPVISADCRSGPREILAPDTDFMYQTREPEFAQYGILMPVFDGKLKKAEEPLTKEEKVWAEVISELLENSKLREYYVKKGKQRIKDFSPEKILPEWKKVIEEVESL